MPDLTPENAEALADAVKRPGVAAAQQVHGMDGVRTLAAMRNADQLRAEVDRLTAELASQKRINMENIRQLGQLLIERHRATYRAAVIEKVRAAVEEASKCMSIDGLDLAAEIAELLPPATQPTTDAAEDAEDIRAVQRALADPRPNIPLADVIAKYDQPTQEGEPR